MVALKQGSVPDVIANKLDHLLILTSGTEQYLITCTNKKYKFLLTTTLTISDWEIYGGYICIVQNYMEKMVELPWLLLIQIRERKYYRHQNRRCMVTNYDLKKHLNINRRCESTSIQIQTESDSCKI